MLSVVMYLLFLTVGLNITNGRMHDHPNTVPRFWPIVNSYFTPADVYQCKVIGPSSEQVKRL